METYGLPSADRTEIIEERRLDSKKWLKVPWSNRPEMHPTANQYIAAGWLLKVVPILGTYERQGAVRIGLVQGEYTYFKDSWSQEEITEKERLEEWTAQLNASVLKRKTLEAALEYVDLNIADPGTAKVMRKLVTAVMALHPVEFK